MDFQFRMRSNLASSGFECRVIDESHQIYIGNLPSNLILGQDEFEMLWKEHSFEFYQIHIHGRTVATPRWQQAYGRDYHYTGRSNTAHPLLPVLQPLVAWCQLHIDEQFNGVLLNWYDAAQGHYIGKHRDSTKNMAYGCPIVTISFGRGRTFRMRPWNGPGYQDFRRDMGA